MLEAIIERFFYPKILERDIATRFENFMHAVTLTWKMASSVQIKYIKRNIFNFSEKIKRLILLCKNVGNQSCGRMSLVTVSGT
jgi:hypothetical protein